MRRPSNLATPVMLLAVLWGIAASAAAQPAAAPAAGAGRDAQVRRTDMPAVSGRTLAECVGRLTAQGGGWCQYLNAAFNRIGYTRAELSAIDSRMIGVGSVAVLQAWNGAAHDPASAEGGTLYFNGGGHADYGGNEVYAFHYRTGVWERLTAPAPYVPIPDDPRGRHRPAFGPPSYHQYGGFNYTPLTKTIFLSGNIAFTFPGEWYPNQELWEFNPSKTEARNGLGALQWRRLRDFAENETRLYGATVLPNGHIWALNGTRQGVFDPLTLTYLSQAAHADGGFGTTTYDATRNVGYVSFGPFYRAANLGGANPFRFGALQRLALNVPFLTWDTGLAADKHGNVLAWPGGKEVLRWDADAGKFFGYLSAQGPSGFRVYTKWVYLPAEDVFLGVSRENEGPWVYKLPSGGGQELATVNVQGFIDRAAPGSTVTIPPAIYAGGLRINKPLTVKLDGVRLTRNVDGKGVILVENAGGPVAIEGFTHTEYAGDDVAAVRVQFSPDTTVRRFHIARTSIGIQTDNVPTHKLTVEDGLIENLGREGQVQLSHGIYAGVGDTFIVRRVTVRRVNNFGHLVKLRGRVNVIEDSKFLGLDGRDSREWEFPCGGDITVRRSVFQKGQSSDNAESGGVALEWGNDGKNCGARDGQPTMFRFIDNWLIFDRTGGPAGGNAFGKWRAGPNDTFEIAGNRIVNQFNWGEFPDLSAQNTMFANRAAAGLGPDEIPRLP